MMTFDEVLEAVKHLTPEQKETLRQAMDETTHQPGERGNTPEERIRLMDEAIAEIRQGMTEQDLKEMTNAMNG
jgi:uncharacterized protein YeeX (DUF496 family)